VTETVAAGARTLTTVEVAREAGTRVDLVDRLVEAGAIHPDAEGMLAEADIPRVRLAIALAEGGIDLDSLIGVIHSGALQLDWVARLWTLARPSGRTFAQFAESLGERAEQLSSIYAAFGLAVPPSDTLMRQDEEDVMTHFIALWALVDDEQETFLRAARIAGEGVRRLQTGTQDLFDELGGPPGVQERRGKSPEEAMQPALRLVGTMGELLVWLQKRHMENETFGRVVSYVESVLVETRQIEPRDPPAIAFVDLSGYTEMTVNAGDERAANFATTLQALAESAARAHRGRVVKLLGDGVMLRFPAAGDAVRCVSRLMAAIVESGLPAGHAGIAAGPIVFRDGDVYGHTVNLASRIANEARASEVLVSAAATESLDQAGIRWVDAGEAQLKGIAQPVRLVRVD